MELPFSRLSRSVTLAATLVLGCGPAFAAPSTTPGELRGASTIHSIGLEWELSGDDDRDAAATVRYRVAGSTTWLAAMPLIRVDYNGENMLAGSILFLQPATPYEVEVALTDPDGGAEIRIVNLSTRAVPVRPGGGRTLHVIPGSGGGSGSEADPFQGMPAAWAAALPGDTFLLHAGSYGDVTDASGASGTAGNPIVWKAYGDGPVVFDFIQLFQRSHLWFEGLTFQYNGSDTAFYSCLTNPGYDNGFQPMSYDVEEIVLLRNHFEGFKHSIRAGPRTRGWYIADNVIIGNEVLGSDGTESWDGEGVELAHGSDHIVAYNEITLTADGISFPESNCDLYGNDIHDVTDDGIELDYGRANTRAWGNRIHNPGNNGIAFQPQGGAPWYILRNQIVNWDESAFKFRDTDRFVVAHNTIVNWNDVLDHWADHLLRGTTRNNLWISINSGDIWRDGSDPADWRTDLDYDGFDWGSNPSPFVYEGQSYADLPALAAASGQLLSGIEIDHTSCFETFDVPGPPPFNLVPAQWMTLAAGCPAVDAGVPLANLNDGFAGTAPDLGAHERGLPLAHYGPRPDDSTPPSVPQGVGATAVSASSIDVAWLAAFDPESSVAYYNVYRDGVAVGNTSTLAYRDSGLQGSTTYSYEVTAVNGAGLESGRSDAAQATTFADTTPPRLLRAEVRGAPTELTVIFDEPVESLSATTISNYVIDPGIAVSVAALEPDLATVTLTTSAHASGVTYTLLVSDVADRASSPNVIAPNSPAQYALAADVNVSNLFVASGEPYEVAADLQVGSSAYIDRSYAYDAIPGALAGSYYIRTANDDKLSSGDATHLSFDVSAGVTVYVAHDDYYATKPDWLAAFTDEGDDVVIDGTTYSLFARDYLAGNVALGGNVHPSSQADNSMYTVIIGATAAAEILAIGALPAPAVPQPSTAFQVDGVVVHYSDASASYADLTVELRDDLDAVVDSAAVTSDPADGSFSVVLTAPAVPGPHQLVVQAADRDVPGLSGELTLPLPVGCPTAPSPTVSGADANLCPETTVQLSTGAYAAYQWSHEGIDIPGATGPTYDASLSGAYSVRVEDGSGCQGVSAAKSTTIGFCPQTEVSPAGAVFPLRVDRSAQSATGHYVYFQQVENALGFNVYEGDLGSWTSHGSAAGNQCDVSWQDLGTGEGRAELTVAAGDRYFLVSAFDATAEGPSHVASNGQPLDPAADSCAP